MSKNDRDPRPNPRPPAGRELSYRSRRVAAGAARPVDLDDVTASPTAGHSGGRPVISNDGAILNPSDDAASQWDCSGGDLSTRVRPQQCRTNPNTTPT